MMRSLTHGSTCCILYETDGEYHRTLCGKLVTGGVVNLKATKYEVTCAVCRDRNTARTKDNGPPEVSIRRIKRSRPSNIDGPN